jgi:hypothetical protein
MHEAEHESLKPSHLLDDRNSLSFQHRFLSVHHSSVMCDDMFVSCKKHCHMYTQSMSTVGSVRQLTLQLLKQLASASRQTATGPAL